MPYWYIFFVKSGRELKVERQFRNTLNSDLYLPFIPMKETLSKNYGFVKKETVIMFPSYVFVESQLSSSEFIQQSRKIILSSKDAIRLLSYGDDDEIAIREEERVSLLKLCNINICVESSLGIIKGDMVIIKEGPLMGRESSIIKIDRHKLQAIICLDFMGVIRQISVALQIVEKI